MQNHVLHMYIQSYFLMHNQKWKSRELPLVPLSVEIKTKTEKLLEIELTHFLSLKYTKSLIVIA